MATQCLVVCFKKIKLYVYQQNETIELVKFVNAQSRYKNRVKRTIILLFEKDLLLEMKNKKIKKQTKKK